MRLVADWVEGRRIGAARQRLREATFGSSARMSLDDPDHENIGGAVAECAFARAIRHAPPEFHPELISDGGVDFPTCVGRIDVKSATKEPWFLPVNDSALAKEPGADYYALIWCPLDAPECFLVGFATRGEMEQAPHVPHVFDPKGLRRTPPPTMLPGRWLPDGHALPPNGLHDPALLVAAVLAGQPASLWICRACQTSVFAAVRPVCPTCGRRRLEANTYACLAAGVSPIHQEDAAQEAWL